MFLNVSPIARSCSNSIKDIYIYIDRNIKISICANSRKKSKTNFKKNYSNSRQINDRFGNSKKCIKLYFIFY